MIIDSLLKLVRDLIWGPPLLMALFGVGLFLTIRLRGLQFRFLLKSLQLTFSRQHFRKGAEGDITQLQALMTSLAAAIGTGNIAGVATALTVGGLGALFWMWVIAFMGMVLKYAEALLASKYRVKNVHGEISGGPMHYLALGCKQPFLGKCYAALGALACIGTGNLIQTHSVADALHSSVGLPPLLSGVILACAIGAVLFGGMHRLASVAEKIVPAMAIIYLGFGLCIIAYNVQEIPLVLENILAQAFDLSSVCGGAFGIAITCALKEGFARGILSNEAGLGTSAIASAAAVTDHPARQALISISGVFLSTIVVCTVTGLVIGVTGVLGNLDPLTQLPLNGSRLAIAAFDSVSFGKHVVTLGLVLFAFTTIMGWAYYGEKMMEFLFGIQSVTFFRATYVGFVAIGAILELETVWTIADIMNGLMVVPNLYALVKLSPIVAAETKVFLNSYLDSV